MTLASRFIRNGTPATDLGGVPVPDLRRPASGPKATMPPVPPLRYLGTRQSSSLSTVESFVPALRDALAELALEPTADRHLAVANAYLTAGIRDHAYDHLMAGLRHDRGNPALHDALARAWRDWGLPQRALSSAHAAVYYAPAAAEVHNTLGTVLWALGQRRDAERAFEDATTLDPGAWYAWSNRCHAAFNRGATKDATAYCRTASQLRRRAREPQR
jgi:Tfp pilus assembly protein PilF